MKVFEFKIEDYTYGVCGESEGEALEYLCDEIVGIASMDEIPQRKFQRYYGTKRQSRCMRITTQQKSLISSPLEKS
jgi:hypothetical protein